MEQKKTLWIIAAVGAFLLVVLGAAGIFYSPAKNPTPTVTTVSQPASQNNNSGWTNTDTADNGLSAQKVNEMIVVSENTNVYGTQQPASTPVVTTPTETTIDLNALKNELSAATTPAPVQPQNINITVTIPDNDKAVVTQNTDSSKQSDIVPIVPAKTPVQKVSAVTPAYESDKETSNIENPVSTVKNVKKSGSENVAKKTEKPAAKKAEPKKITQYWVQVASYSNKKGAEGARSILDANKISSDIFTYEDNKGDVYFRVRVGPYMTKSEAEYWQTRIMKIPYFEKNDSYITATTK